MSCDRKIGPYSCCSVVQGDCLELMKSLPDGCVDAVITDPPYGIGRANGMGAGGFDSTGRWNYRPNFRRTLEALRGLMQAKQEMRRDSAR